MKDKSKKSCLSNGGHSSFSFFLISKKFFFPHKTIRFFCVLIASLVPFPHFVVICYKKFFNSKILFVMIQFMFCFICCVSKFHEANNKWPLKIKMLVSYHEEEKSSGKSKITITILHYYYLFCSSCCVLNIKFIQ